MVVDLFLGFSYRCTCFYSDSQAHILPARDIVQFAIGYALIGLLTLIAWQVSLHKRNRRLEMLDALASDDHQQD